MKTIKNISFELKLLLSFVFVVVLGLTANTFLFTSTETMSCIAEEKIQSNDGGTSYLHEFEIFWFRNADTRKSRIVDFESRPSIFGQKVFIRVDGEWLNACGANIIYMPTKNVKISKFNNQIICSFDWNNISSESEGNGSTSIRWDFDRKLITGDYFSEYKKSKETYNFDFEIYCQ